jgi:hypothetical protein
MPTDLPRKRSRRTLLAAVILAGCLAAVPATAIAFSTSSFPSAAVTARTLAVHESIQAHLVTHRGTTVLNEQGRGSGTFSCPMMIDLKLTYTEATVTFTCSASKGSISGRGVTSYYAGGHTAYFSGAVSVTSGSGSYSHASGSLHISGTLTRGSYSISATVNGNIRL